MSLGQPLSCEPLFLIQNMETTFPAALSLVAETQYLGLVL